MIRVFDCLYEKALRTDEDQSEKSIRTLMRRMDRLAPLVRRRWVDKRRLGMHEEMKRKVFAVGIP